MKKSLFLILSVLILLPACSGAPDLLPGTQMELVSIAEDPVTVVIRLQRDDDDQVWLSAAFLPRDESIYFYSKDTPFEGVEGVGRPTLLELAPGSRIVATGVLVESSPATQKIDVPGLLAYPAGAVTLRLPVQLPTGGGWVREAVLISYMACSAGACYPPVIRREVPVRVPGADVLSQP